ncbi:MAG: helix-turn-helix domain-containing protein [Anaerolineae bacterium]
MRYGERLRAARISKDWTQAQLTEASGVSQSLISQLERSATATGSEYTVRLSRALAVSPDWLADETGAMKPTTYAVTDPKLIAICIAMQDSAEYVKDAAVKAVLQTRELAEQARADSEHPNPDHTGTHG